MIDKEMIDKALSAYFELEPQDNIDTTKWVSRKNIKAALEASGLVQEVERLKRQSKTYKACADILEEEKAHQQELLQEARERLGLEYHVKLDKKLINEAAKPPYQNIFAMTDLGNLLLKAFREAGFEAQFAISTEKEPIEFTGFKLKLTKHIEGDS